MTLPLFLQALYTLSLMILTYYFLVPMAPPPMAPLPCQALRGAYTGRTEPRLVVLDKANGGKADALNAGLNAARYPLVCCVDADGLLEPDAVRQMACLFARRENTVAVGGMVRPMNGCTARAGRINRIQLPRKPLELVQVVEYLRAFLTSRFGWESINSLLIVSGAFGMFDRAAVLEAGGYDHTIGEDAELTLRLHRRMLDTGRPYTIAMALDAVCWTQVPADLRGLRTQRIRWQKGLADALWKHRALLLNPRYGRVGMLALPFFWFSELLGPLVELLGYLLLAAALLLGVAAPRRWSCSPWPTCTAWSKACWRSRQRTAPPACTPTAAACAVCCWSVLQSPWSTAP